MEWIRSAKFGCMYENTLCGNTVADLRIWPASGGATISGACNVYDTEVLKANATGPGADWACGAEPNAGFSTSESVPGTIEFTDSSTPGNQGDSVGSWYWDFGDCSDPGTSTDQNPTHTYARGGTYTVCLSVNDANVCGTTPCDSGYNLSCTGTEGRRDTICQEVVVQEPQEQPDMVISEKSEEWIDPADPLQGYRVKFTVKNQGTGSANASVTCLTIDGTPAGDDQDCTALAPGKTYSGTFEGPFICSGDNDTIEVCADCNDEVTEGNEGNNCKENDWTCPAVSKPDLVITAKSEEWIDPADPSQGYKVYYTVKNQGTGSADASATCLTIDGTASGTDQARSALDPGATYSGTFEGPFTCSGDSDTVKVCADCNDVVSESYEDNNCEENEWACSGLIFDIRNGIGEPGCTDRLVNVSLKNSVSITGIQVDICNGGGCLSLADVELTERSSGFSVEFQDDYPQSGCARIILYSTTGALIGPGDGPVVILHYDVDSTATGSCVDLTSDNLFITDEYDEPLTAAEDPGIFFLGIYGDPWPYDNGIVGDGQVNIHDVVRDIQICLGIYTPTDCEFVAGDVPTGFGFNCRAPDEQINISDVLETVAKILARDNCIDSY
jgi:archaellum component FlaF (FlaF/FlaG flagellin family)